MVDGYLGLGSGDMSEGKYYAVECIEEIPFNDPVLVKELEKKHHRFAGFGYKLDEISACDAWPKATPDASLKRRSRAASRLVYRANSIPLPRWSTAR
jgi:hypothetical protein